MRPSRIALGAVTAVATALAAVAVGLAAIGVNLAQAQGGDMEAVVKDYLAARPEEARRLVKDYLVRNPQVLQEALVEQRQRDSRAAIKSNAAALYNSGKQVTLGNPKGDVTLVEFVDYNCGFCRRALGDMLELIRSDANLKVVLFQHPVLGAGSAEAARIAIAVQMQDRGPAKYLEFHRKLMAGPGPANKARARAVAADLGIDVARIDADLARPEIDATIEESKKLARALGIRGTPSYVLCDSIIFGAVGIGPLRSKIAAARQAQQDSGQRCEFYAFDRP